MAQTEPETDDSTRYDDIAAHLNLTEFQIMCLEANHDGFRDAASPNAEELRAAQRTLRTAARNGEDTTAIQAEVDVLVAQINSIRTTYVISGQSCLDSIQKTQLGELVAAETLMQEVRQGVGLLLLESTEERTSNIVRRRHVRRR